MYLTAKFDRPTFSRLEVIVRTNILTNKQTLLKTSTALCDTTPVGNQVSTVTSKHQHGPSIKDQQKQLG